MQRRSKYNAKPQRVDGHYFRSGLEARRYGQLKLLAAAGEIADLVVHPKFELFPKTKTDCAETWEADFGYTDVRTGQYTVEDTKGVDLSLGRLKRRVLRLFHPAIVVRVVTKDDC